MSKFSKKGSKVNVALAAVNRNREARVKKAMEAQHRATVALSGAQEQREEREIEIAEFVRRTQKLLLLWSIRVLFCSILPGICSWQLGRFLLDRTNGAKSAAIAK